MASLSPSTSALPKGQESEEELFADTEFVPAKNGGSWRIDLPDFLRGITKPKTVRGISLSVHLNVLPFSAHKLQVAKLPKDVVLSQTVSLP